MQSETDSQASAGEPRKFKIYSVSEITGAIRTLLTTSIKAVTIEGEISGWKPCQNGNAYFTLKDENAVIRCAMFAAARRACAYDGKFKDGVKVQMWGRIDVYEKRGDYQLVVLRARLAGEGELMARFNELKAKLEAEGLFAESRKRPIPFLPHRIGVVTSPTGAVIHDILNVVSRRFPNVELRLYPAKVQGDGAAAEVVAGIEYFNDPARNGGFEADVLIVGRGGGSIEDLWCFNEEPLVRAVAASRIPVISAVGHETDFTLCDFAADLRAGTPSIAAERALPVKAELASRVGTLSDRMSSAIANRVQSATQSNDYLALQLSSALTSAASAASARLAHAGARLAPALASAHANAGAKVTTLSARLAPALSFAQKSAAANINVLDSRIGQAVRFATVAAEARFERDRDKLNLLSPYSVLERGYSLTTDEKGNVVTSASKVKSGDLLRTRLADGTVESKAV